MALVNFSNLDFDQIKSQIKSYLRTNSDFTDFDFDGSNFSILLDTLAYNTYISSYNANMLANEVFIDAATLREKCRIISKKRWLYTEITYISEGKDIIFRLYINIRD